MKHIPEMSLEQGISYYEKTKSSVPSLINSGRNVCQQALTKRNLSPDENGKVSISTRIPPRAGQEEAEDLVAPCLEVLGRVMHNLQEARELIEKSRLQGGRMLREKRDAFDMVDDHLKELNNHLKKNNSEESGPPRQIRLAHERSQEELALLVAVISEETEESSTLTQAIHCYVTCEQAVRKGIGLLEALDSTETAQQKDAVKEILRWREVPEKLELDKTSAQ